jgi:hypothetical protein
MKLDQKVIDRFQTLIAQTEKIVATRTSRSNEYVVSFRDDYVNFEIATQWATSCLSLLGRVFGKESEHYTKLDALFPKITDYHPFKQAVGIIKSAKEDYENGFIFETRTLIEAEVFDDFLEQAEYLFNSGYIAPSAIITGSVLEDGLRKLCQRKGISLPAKPKLDSMNTELAKAGVYNTLVQKRVTALADLRNKAAHGKWSEFSKDDVKNMLTQVRSFMGEYFS